MVHSQLPGCPTATTNCKSRPVGAGGTGTSRSGWQRRSRRRHCHPLALAAGTVTQVSPELAVLAPNTTYRLHQRTVHGPVEPPLAAGQTSMSRCTYMLGVRRRRNRRSGRLQLSRRDSTLARTTCTSSRSPVGVGYPCALVERRPGLSPPPPPCRLLMGKTAQALIRTSEREVHFRDVRGPGGAS